MYRTQSRAHGPCCSSSRICLPVTRAGSGSCVRRGARRRPAVPLLTLPGLDACPLEGAELPVRRRRGADATRPRVGEGRGATHPTGPSASPTAALPHGSSSAVARGHSEEGTKWQVRSEHSACHTGDALQGGDSILSSSPPAPSSFFLSPGSAPPGLLASRTLRLKLRL